MLTLAALGMVTLLCGAYDGWEGGGSHDGKAGGDHKPDFKWDGYHDWLSPWDGHAKDYWHKDYSTKVYTYPVYYYYYSAPYYYYPHYSWYYTPQYYDPWWATNVYTGVKYSFKSGWSYHSGFGFGDP